MGARYSSCAPVESLVFEQEVSIVLPVGAQTVNVFQVTGVVRVLNQWARITEVTLMDNVTAVYATLYDGTTTTNLTANGITLSNLGVNTYFTKDQLSAQTYSLLPGNVGGMLETIADRDAGRPFTVNQKSGVNTYIQLNATAGGSQQSFKMVLHFEYRLLNGGSNLEFLL